MPLPTPTPQPPTPTCPRRPTPTNSPCRPTSPQQPDSPAPLPSPFNRQPPCPKQLGKFEKSSTPSRPTPLASQSTSIHIYQMSLTMCATTSESEALTYSFRKAGSQERSSKSILAEHTSQISQVFIRLIRPNRDHTPSEISTPKLQHSSRFWTASTTSYIRGARPTTSSTAVAIQGARRLCSPIAWRSSTA